MERAWSKPLPPAQLLVRGGRVVDPLSGLDGVQDVLVDQGTVTEVGTGFAVPKGCREVDAAGMLVLPASSTCTCICARRAGSTRRC